jgi:pyruvate/2-oxoglutarate dehydrogenase complex dihydrolipoamide acyltransferase (E2) component
MLMRHEILLPALGDAESGEISEWYRSSGDVVAVGEPVVAVDVDKVVMDIPTQAAGVLTVAAAEGAEVRVGDLLGWITDDTER